MANNSFLSFDFPMKIGIDLAGTKIEIIALDTTGQILLRQRVATPQGDYHATVNTITELVTEVEKELGEQGSVGIGNPRFYCNRHRFITQFKFCLSK